MDNETLKSFVFEGGAKDREQGLSLKEDCRQGWQKGVLFFARGHEERLYRKKLEGDIPNKQIPVARPKAPYRLTLLC